ncbi:MULTISPECIES: imidazole glycerol phosphate synthase subunit HisH [Thalassospira]|uniref:Imidazole glycerol phosphate synthase subunit HisH n=1 Tax=Thalassospira povalilytica TaxID=732237 RepID=A0A8I1M6N3_9PROT|nr:imidazole glycerol phosphate synthase subunit HisH [Thalassospira povalilytica]MBN8195900.1 imidazole glycerol phosphate synthase subunit HisH [Thalassospira povalilytica]PKR52348.1 imidazole glycerol phosphate synthase subunit HisH [Thalassospira povalilytica]
MTVKSVAILDHGLCNIHSIARSFEQCGANVSVVTQAKDICSADRLVLPGVGAFSATVKILRAGGYEDAIKEFAKIKERPLLGVCLGMQLLADTSEEGGMETGLGLVPGRVVRLNASKGERIPHVGWNEVMLRSQSRLFSDIPNCSDFYFVHSYKFVCEDNYVIGVTDYCGGFVSAVSLGNVSGVQFHPEKSQGFGRKVLNNFMLA